MAGRDPGKGGFVGGHRTILVFVTFAAMAAARANNILRFIFQSIATNGGVQPLPYTCLFLRDSFSPPPSEKYFFPTNHIFRLGAVNKTSLKSGKEGRCLDPHDDVPSVVNCLRQVVDIGYGTTGGEATWKWST